MDDITRRYLQHLVQYEPFQIGFPKILEALRQAYFQALLLAPNRRSPLISDDTLRGKIDALADMEVFVQRLGQEMVPPPPPQKEEEWVDREPFARVRTD